MALEDPVNLGVVGVEGITARVAHGVIFHVLKVAQAEHVRGGVFQDRGTELEFLVDGQVWGAWCAERGLPVAVIAISSVRQKDARSNHVSQGNVVMSPEFSKDNGHGREAFRGRGLVNGHRDGLVGLILLVPHGLHIPVV